MVHSILSWLIWAEIVCKQRVSLPKRPINQFEPVQQKQAPRAYCTNIYTVSLSLCTMGNKFVTANSKKLGLALTKLTFLSCLQSISYCQAYKIKIYLGTIQVLRHHDFDLF